MTPNCSPTGIVCRKRRRTTSGGALVATSKSSGVRPRSWSRTQPPAKYASCPAPRSRRTMPVAPVRRSAMGPSPSRGPVGEQHLHGSRLALLAAGEEGLAVLVEREAMAQNGRAIDPPLGDQVEVDLHGVP